MYHKQHNITFATYGLLGLAGAVSFMLPNSAPTTQASPLPQPTTPNQIRLTGVVHDFLKGNADFHTTPSGGNGHYAGNVGPMLGLNDRPTYTGAGFKVASQWHDKDGHQIAPHLFSDAYSLHLVSAPAMDQGTTLNTWDSAVGPYGGANVGPTPGVVTGSIMPSITPPTALGLNVGTAFYQNGPPANSTPVTLNSDIHCDNFTSRQSTTFNITAPITIFCENSFTPNKQNIFNIQPGGSLTIYVKGLFKIHQTTLMNMNTWKPNLLKVYNLGTTQMEINQSCQFCGQIVSPLAQLHLAQNDQFFGTFVGTSLDVDQSSGVHIDKSIPRDSCNNIIADLAGTKGVNSNGGLVSAVKFADWYNDVLGVNASVSSSIILTKNSSGVYEYLTDDFHPIDNQVLGNEGESHNNFFTYALTVQFVHHACQGGFFEFQGCDDSWLFINRQLGIDLGGMVPNTVQYVAVDRFNLQDGQTYTLNFFYAQRQAGCGTFRLRTNLDLIGEVVAVPVTAMFD